MPQYTILVVDDEKIQRETLAGFLKKCGYQTVLAKSAEDAYQIILNRHIDIVLTDFKMSGKTGLELLEDIKKLNPEITVIIMTAYGKIEDAVTAMKAGAFNYLTKPIDLDEVEALVKHALQFKRLASENRRLKDSLMEKHRFTNIISNSSNMEETLNLAARAADSKTSILIQGESGTGKELIARAVHYSSPRKDKAMITVNCAAISENLLESELFGHEKGSFTGAIAQKTGRVEEAEGGTLFLDEVGDIPLSIQVKLLRFLQFSEFQRVGGNQVQKIDVRIITATNRDLQAMIKEKTFREDFYYRLNVINIIVPPLRNRKEDIPLLIDFFIKKYAAQNQKEIKQISREALDILMKYDYPGNVRELENLIERAVVLARDTIITRDDLPIQFALGSEQKTMKKTPLEYYEGSFKEKTEAFEKDLIIDSLKMYDFNQSRAAESIGMTERNIRYKMQKYGLK
jgi:two-component system NtrC family response regulator